MQSRKSARGARLVVDGEKCSFEKEEEGRSEVVAVVMFPVKSQLMLAFAHIHPH